MTLSKETKSQAIRLPKVVEIWEAARTIRSRVVATAAKVVDQPTKQRGTRRAPGIGLEAIDLAHAVVGVGVLCHLTGNRTHQKIEACRCTPWVCSPQCKSRVAAVTSYPAGMQKLGTIKECPECVCSFPYNCSKEPL